MPKKKLTMQDARRLRRDHEAGVTGRKLAVQYGISTATVSRIVLCYSYREYWMPRKYQRSEATREVMNCENCDRRFVYWWRKNDPERHYCSRRCNLLAANKVTKKLPDAETLARLYHFKGWSLQRIALHYGCCFQVVHYAMQRANIKRRPRPSRIVKWQDKTQTITEWAKEQNVNLQTVYSRMDSGQTPIQALRLGQAR